MALLPAKAHGIRDMLHILNKFAGGKSQGFMHTNWNCEQNNSNNKNRRLMSSNPLKARPAPPVLTKPSTPTTVSKSDLEKSGITFFPSFEEQQSRIQKQREQQIRIDRRDAFQERLRKQDAAELELQGAGDLARSTSIKLQKFKKPLY
ncbi:hypothetical protein OHC33_003684 [Knufia fluminis]|uniref:Uncharacterized protein n=1 Tax=Knufia fluminis TaxID=191047 RepID=A0AAN8ES95_9EURO|nr:hypothetical protein OHC33_003684 [Knufia fluminis]